MYISYLHIIIYTGIVFLLSSIILIICCIWRNRCQPKMTKIENDEQHVNATSREHITNGMSKPIKSASSKNLPVIVKIPSLADSSIITQGTMEMLLPKSKASSPSSSVSNGQSNQHSQKLKRVSSKSMKISEYSQSDVHGKMSIGQKN